MSQQLITVHRLRELLSSLWMRLIEDTRYGGSTNSPGSKLFSENYNYASYWRSIIIRLNSDIKKRITILPEISLIFEGINRVPIEKLRVVILGQDPYPNPRDACGIAFASKSGERTSSIGVIEREIKRSYGENAKMDYSFRSWISQGVMLLNTALTIPYPSSEKQNHREIGWSEFVKDVLDAVLTNFSVVLLTFGAYARELFADYRKVRPSVTPLAWISTIHPSPRANASARVPFVGSNVFKRCNQILIENKLLPIRWFI